jgi:hypothetical protein
MARAPGALLKGPTTRPLQQLRDRALVPIHPNAWKENSPKLNFRFTEFSEVRLKGVLGTSPRIHREFTATCLTAGTKMLRISQRFE